MESLGAISGDEAPTAATSRQTLLKRVAAGATVALVLLAGTNLMFGLHTAQPLAATGAAAGSEFLSLASSIDPTDTPAAATTLAPAALTLAPAATTLAQKAPAAATTLAPAATTLAQNIAGNPACPCLPYSVGAGTRQVEIDNENVSFPLDTGASCQAWEADNHPDCGTPAPAGGRPGWCDRAWCFVDPCNCNTDTPPAISSYYPTVLSHKKHIFYSYVTCGAEDAWTANSAGACVNKDTETACNTLPNKCAWQNDVCRAKELAEECVLAVQ